MPFKIEKNKDKKSYKVSNKETGKVYAYHSRDPEHLIQVIEYFKKYVVFSEASQEELKNNKSSEKQLAKYYLAAINYYEPNFDFENADLNQVESLGKAYLKELFQENILQFIEKSKKKQGTISTSAISTPSYDTPWKYFAYAMLTTKSNAQIANVIYQPVIVPTMKPILIPRFSALIAAIKNKEEKIEEYNKATPITRTNAYTVICKDLFFLSKNVSVNCHKAIQTNNSTKYFVVGFI